MEIYRGWQLFLPENEDGWRYKRDRQKLATLVMIYRGMVEIDKIHGDFTLEDVD